MTGWHINTGRHGRFEVDRAGGTLTLPNLWCKVRGLPSLRGRGEPDIRGVRLAGLSGEQPVPAPLTPLIRTLTLYLRADIAWDNSLAATPVATLEKNLDRLQHFFDPVDTGDGAIAARLILPSGTQRTARAQFWLDVPEHGIESTWGTLPLRVRIGTGRFT